MIYTGIDPGKSGAAAAIDESGKLMSTCTFKHGTYYDLSDWMADHRGTAIIELVGPRQEDRDRLGSMAKLMENYGILQGLLTAHRIPYTRVAPQKWQKTMRIPPRLGKSHTAHKRVLKQRAQELYPEANITLANADAILLAVYCRLSSKLG